MRQGVSEAANTTHPMNIRPCKLSNSDITDQVRIDTKERDEKAGCLWLSH
jgi:hypothetical protein